MAGWPTISAGNFPGNNWDADNHKDQNLTTYVIEDNLTKVAGRHTMTFGGSVHREYNNVRELQQAQGSHDFAEDWTAQYDPAGDQAVSFTGVGVASMALGLPTFLSNQYNRGYFYFQQTEVGLVLSRQLESNAAAHLELGLRWEKWTPYQEKYNRLVNVDIRNFANNFQVVTPGSATMESLPGIPPSVLTSWAARGLTWTTADKAGLPGKLIPADNNDFGPRLGAAYRITNKTVLRAGYGKYFWTMPLSQILQTSRTNPPLNLRYTNPLGSLDGTSSFATRTKPIPDYFVGKAQVDINGNIVISQNAQSAIPYDFRNWSDSNAQEWHFTLEREVDPQHVAALELHRRACPAISNSAWRSTIRRPSTTMSRARGWPFPETAISLASIRTGTSATASSRRSATRTRIPRKWRSSGATPAAWPSSGSTPSPGLSLPPTPVRPPAAMAASATPPDKRWFRKISSFWASRT